MIDNVSNGNTGGMPDFSHQLTKAQINAVAVVRLLRDARPHAAELLTYLSFQVIGAP